MPCLPASPSRRTRSPASAATSNGSRATSRTISEGRMQNAECRKRPWAAHEGIRATRNPALCGAATATHQMETGEGVGLFLKEECRMQNAEKDLGPRTKAFARRVIRLYVALPRQPVARSRSE